MNQSANPIQKRMFVRLLATVGLLILCSLPTFAVPPKVGEPAPDFALKGLDKAETRLSVVNKKGPIVLVALRGFPGYQCPICNVQVRDLIKQAKGFSDAGAQVLLVYPGPSEGLQEHADEFVRGKDMPANFRVLIDPEYWFLKKYDIRWDEPGETSYPSTFVIDRKGKIVFAKTSKSHGDRAKTAEVLKALAQLSPK